MPVNFIVEPKLHPSKPLEPAKYYARIVTKGSVDLRDLADDIASYTSLSTPDCLAMIEALLQSISKHIDEGKTVKLGDFGLFSLSIQSEGQKTAKLVTARCITSNKLNFRLGKEMRKKLTAVKYKKR